MMPKNYLALEKKFEQLNNINNIKAMLHWDSATMMPDGGASERSKQLAYLESLSHTLLISDELQELLMQNEENQNNLDDWQKANVEVIKHLVCHARAIPKKLVETFSKASSAYEMQWRSAKAQNDFKSFSKLFKEVLNISKDIARCKAELFEFKHVYDGLLDQFDRGCTSEKIDNIFAELYQFLPNFIEEVKEHQNKLPKLLSISGHYSDEKQFLLGKQCMQSLGFDFNHGRIDISNHPFCGGIPGDTRITTRYDANNFISSLLAVVHETGHALYQNNLPTKYRSQPVGAAYSLAIHESQSLFLEMQIASSKEFITFFHPYIIDILELDENKPEFSVDNIFRHITHVKSSLIRVEADEVTYPAHIMLRYKLEKAMIEGALTVDELPEAWNDEMYKLLGIKATNYKDGCMQDIHWPSGLIGYFPTYSLGAIIAAQLGATIATKLGNIGDYIIRGDFITPLTWLKDNIHSYGSKYNSGRLVENATGNPISTSYYIDYLRKKYLS
ncbi:Thermostable carboxypeptidase 1 [Rickettsiales bacterium Ac37b]|nr:Thermostable carboxypeptidase 1 [Rickettsiales bacterium Ac37b]